jgi:hypothetical protein
MPLHPRTCSFLYSISCLLDALDGAAARQFNQSTKFGAVLDMVTDRCTTACLLVFLSSAWPRWALLFQGLISLDLASHYIHMFATLTMGGVDQSHKKVDSSRSRILNLYYTNNVSNIYYSAASNLHCSRSYCLSSAPSTRHSSSPCISSLSALRFSHPHFSNRFLLLPLLYSQETHHIHPPVSFSPHPTVQVLSSSHVPINWIPSGHGSLPASPCPSWLRSN